MSYFDDLGGRDAVMTGRELMSLAAPERRRRLTEIAEAMAPALLGTVSWTEAGAEIRGRYAVHEARAELARDTGALTLTLRTRRALNASRDRFLIEGPMDHPSRTRLTEIPHGAGELLNRLLDSMPDGQSWFVLRSQESVLFSSDPELMALSKNPCQRLSSVAHLAAYLTSQAELLWPLDATAPLRMPELRQDAGRLARESDDMPLPVPGYGMPPEPAR